VVQKTLRQSKFIGGQGLLGRVRWEVNLPTATLCDVARIVLIGFGAGVFSGAFGVGGGIILVPLLVLLFRFPQKRAQATSLVMVTLAAAAGFVTYAVNGEVAWIAAAFIMIGGLAGSLLGSHLVQRSSDHRLQMAFGLILVIVAARLFVSAFDLIAPSSTETVAADVFASLNPVTAVAFAGSGLAMGLLSALFGVGGGIVVIPILVTLFDFRQQLAAGTSLAVMVPIAFLGAWRQSTTGATDWSLGFRLGVASIPGGILGAFLAVSVSGSLVRGLFALLVAIVGVRMIKEGWEAKADRR
jgi:uncharacterized membrane protein YfcA